MRDDPAFRLAGTRLNRRPKTEAEIIRLPEQAAKSFDSSRHLGFPAKGPQKRQSQDVTQICFGIKREAQPLSELISEGEVAVRRKTACTKFCDDVQ
jgi:hypothetical protein